MHGHARRAADVSRPAVQTCRWHDSRLQMASEMTINTNRSVLASVSLRFLCVDPQNGLKIEENYEKPRPHVLR